QDKPIKTENVTPITTLQFFPEGGDLLTDIDTRVAFKALSQLGKPVKLSGAIKDSKGTFIDSFSTEHDGMGSLSLHPQSNETYTAFWKDEFGITNTTSLPAIKNSGANLQVQPLASKSLVLIKRTAEVDESLKILYVVASMNQHMVYKAKINLTSNNTSLAEIPTAFLPTGVLQITLFNANWLPVAERVVFVNNHQHEFNPEITTPATNMRKRSKNVIELNVPDSVI